MKHHITIVAAIAVVAFAGCGSPTATNAARIANRDAEASGSPFRWITTNVQGGTMMTRVMTDLPSGSSKADETLKRDILQQIATAELSKQRRPPEVEEVRLLANGEEVWILKHPKDGIAYIVHMKPSAEGGTNFSINGPHLFEKKG